MNSGTRKERRRRRHRRCRPKLRGTADRPRLAVSVSNRHASVQLIDDVAGRTLSAVTTCGEREHRNVTVATARRLGERLAAAAKDKGIERIVFDRGGHRYHGRVKAIADAARESGLEF